MLLIAASLLVGLVSALLSLWVSGALLTALLVALMALADWRRTRRALDSRPTEQ